MLINMTMVYELLTNHNPKLHLSKKDSDQISSVVLLRGNEQIYYNSNLLYVAKASDLVKIMPIESPLSVVCVEDIPLTIALTKFNLILVDSSSNIQNIYNDINTLLTNRVNLHKSTTKLYNALLSGRGLDHIVNIATEVLGNPVLVYNRAYKILSYSKNVAVEDALWNDLVTKGYSSYDNYNLIKEDMEKVELTDNPTFLEGKLPYRGLVTKIKIGEKNIGYVSTTEQIRPFHENDLELMRLLSKLIATELQKDNLLSQTKGLLYEQLIIELLDSERINQNYLEDRLNFLDLSLKENLYVLTARQKTGHINPLPFYRDILSSLIPGSKSVLYNNDLIYLISRRKNKPLNIPDIEKALKFLEENNMYAGLSRCFHDIWLIRRFYIQSCKAIEIGSRLKEDEVFFTYDEYALHNLLDIASEQSDLRDFCSNSIFELMEYDNQNNAKFLETLYVYLACGCNISKAASILHVHRNSIDYRIKKVEEILNIDINDAETHFTLYTSFKILSFLKDDQVLEAIKQTLPTLEKRALKYFSE